MIDWALIALICVVGIFLSFTVGGVAAALPHPPTASWSDRLRSGTKAFGTSLTLFIAVVSMVCVLIATQK
ncbi:hypothetical protein [Streptomyces sp. NPDC054961]